MDEEIQIINENTRREKFKNFITKYKKILIGSSSAFILIIFLFFLYSDFKHKNQLKIADKFNEITTSYDNKKNENIVQDLTSIIYKKDKTYSPLALNFLIDNKIVNDKEKINKFFDIIINEIKLEKEIKNLITYKQALYNAESSEENNLLKILNPILNSDSIWKSHSLYLMAEYFYSKNEKEKSKEFLNRIIELDDANPNIKIEAQKRIRRDFSD